MLSLSFESVFLRLRLFDLDARLLRRSPPLLEDDDDELEELDELPLLDELEELELSFELDEADLLFEDFSSFSLRDFSTTIFYFIDFCDNFLFTSFKFHFTSLNRQLS